MVECRNLSFAFGEKKILSGASLVLEKNKVTALLGESGIGKSTLSRLLSGILLPSEGEILLQGELLSSPRGYDRKRGLQIQMVYQQPQISLDPRQKLSDGIRELVRYHHLTPRGEEEAFLSRWMKVVDLEKDTLNHLPHQISGGEAQRVSLLKALMLSPKVLVLDEATSMLDVSTQANVLSQAREEMLSRGGAILLITHEKALAEHYADTIYTLRNLKMEKMK